IDTTPNVGINTTPSTVSRLNIFWTDTTPATVGGATMAALFVGHTAAPTSPSSALYAGFSFTAATSGTQNFSNRIFGGVGNATHGSSGTLSSAIGFEAEYIQNASTGTVTTARAFFANVGF